MDLLRKKDRAELFNIMKYNYKTNLVWYILIWIILLIPIIFCTIYTVKIINWGENIENYIDRISLLGLSPDEYGAPHYVIEGSPVELLDFLWIFILSCVFILSKRKTCELKNQRDYILFSIILYSVVLALITIWFGNVTVVTSSGGALGHYHATFTGWGIIILCWFSLSVLSCFLGSCYLTYRFIKWLCHKFHYIVIILIGLFLLPIFGLWSVLVFFLFMISVSFI